MGGGSEGWGFWGRLGGFLVHLRRYGLQVGLGEGIDVAKALGCINVLRREDFYLACRETLLKRPEDLAAFDVAFQEYWRPEVGGEAYEPPGIPPAPELIPQVAGDVGRVWRGLDPTDRLPPEGGGTQEATWGFIYSPDAPPGRRPLVRLDRRELLAMRHLARRFRRWAASVEGRRRVPSRRGEVDFPRTARASLRLGGEWVVVRRHRRKLLRTRLVVLWDVSSSMEGHHSLLLGLIYVLLRTIPSTEVFSFSTDLQSVTAALRGRPYSQALLEVSRRLTRSRGGTRIGRSLEEFNRRYRGLVDRRTVVLIMSDGWDLGDLDLLEAQLAALRRRCKFLLWMNPYADGPDFRPEVAGMRRALPQVDFLIPPSALIRRDLFQRHFGWPAGSPTSRGWPATPSPA